LAPFTPPAARSVPWFHRTLATRGCG
jgi:hypothetical protein